MKPSFKKLIILLMAATLITLVSCSGIPEGEPGVVGAAAESECIDLDKASGLPYVNNEIIVFVTPEASQPEIDALFQSLAASVDTSMADVGIYRLIFAEAMTFDDLEALLESVKSNPIVEDADLNYVTELELE